MALIVSLFILTVTLINKMFFKELVRVEKLIWLICVLTILSTVLILVRPEHTAMIVIVARFLGSI